MVYWIGFHTWCASGGYRRGSLVRVSISNVSISVNLMGDHLFLSMCSSVQCFNSFILFHIYQRFASIYSIQWSTCFICVLQSNVWFICFNVCFYGSYLFHIYGINVLLLSIQCVSVYNIWSVSVCLSVYSMVSMSRMYLICHVFICSIICFCLCAVCIYLSMVSSMCQYLYLMSCSSVYASLSRIHLFCSSVRVYGHVFLCFNVNVWFWVSI